jgi:hypothetical protein
MYHQSTAPLPRPVQRRRPPAFIGFALAIVILGAGLGFAAYAIMQRSVSVPVAPAPSVPRPTPVDPLAVGALGSFNRATMVWVDETGLWAMNRAVENRDDKRGMDALDLWQHFDVAPGTALRITNRRGEAFQVEVLDGPLAGRRGWTSYGSFFVPRP